MTYGFLKVASAIPATKVADCQFNIQEIKRLADEAQQQGAQIICFPELSVTGYSCADLFAQQLLLCQAEKAVQWLLQENAKNPIITIIGAPVSVSNMLFNTAIVIQGDRILGIVPKTYLPNYKEFYEQRWFASANTIPATSINYARQDNIPFNAHFLLKLIEQSQSPANDTSDAILGIELCEDLWAPIPPSSHLALQGADIICNLSASNELIGKNQYLRSLIAQQSARTISGYIYSSCGYGESTQDVVYGGNALIYENGKLLAQSKRFEFTPQLTIADIDIESLRNERRMNTTFAASLASALSGFPAEVTSPAPSALNGFPAEITVLSDSVAEKIPPVSAPAGSPSSSSSLHFSGESAPALSGFPAEVTSPAPPRSAVFPLRSQCSAIPSLRQHPPPLPEGVWKRLQPSPAG